MNGENGEESFNSLCEILQDADLPILSTKTPFNSLCEIRRLKTFQLNPTISAFNSLCEIHEDALYSNLQNLGILSILYVRFILH